MQFPEFHNDDEMAAWFEAHDVSASDLEPADDVVIAPDLAATLIAGIYSMLDNGSSAAPAVARSSGEVNANLKPVAAVK